jgi:hypothetical protein
VVAGVFEIRDRAGDAIVAVNLVDELTYRIRANAGPGALAPMRPGLFMTARIVPLGGDWMLSGAQTLFHASERTAMLRLAAEQATRPWPAQRVRLASVRPRPRPFACSRP